MAEPDPTLASDGGWPARPRALTPRGVLLVIGVLVFAVAMAAASVYLRRTRLEKTTAFWGPETIRALQSGDTMRLVIPADSPLLEEEGVDATTQHADTVTDLSGTPGLGHLRHALLDERHYDWSTLQKVDVDQVDVAEPEFVTIELEGPPADIVPSQVRLELSEGWAGTPEGGRSVQLTERVRTAMRHYLLTLQDIHMTPSP